jgi:hypothetical protein
MKYILTILTCFILTNIKAQELNINSYSYKSTISNKDTTKNFTDSVKIVINNNEFIKGKDNYRVLEIQQSKISPNKYRIYYLKPSNSRDFEYDIDVAEFDENYNCLKLSIGLGSIYRLYIK